MTKKVYFDAGHGKYTAGKRSPSGVFEEREWFLNNEVATSFEKQLKKYNGVSLHRTDDPTGERDVPLKERTDKANNGKADIYISFHHNALYDNKWGTHTGVETFYHKASSNGKKLAELVQKEVVRAYGLRDRGIKTNNLHITRETNMPAVLVEGGFMDSTTDIVKLRDKKVLHKAGELIADAVAKYFGLSKKTSSTSTNSKPTASKPSTSTATKPSTKPSASREMYRVRKDWNKPQTQIGAYTNLDYAKDAVDKNKGYKVFDSKGKVVYSGKKTSTSNQPKPSTNSKPATNTTTSNKLKVGQTVTVKKTATKFATGQSMASFVKGSKYKIKQVQSDRVLLDKIDSWVKNSDIVEYSPSKTTVTTKDAKTTTKNTKTIKVGDTVTVKKTASKFTTGQSIASFVKGSKYKVLQVKSDSVLLDGINSWVYKKDLV